MNSILSLHSTRCSLAAAAAKKPFLAARARDSKAWEGEIELREERPRATRTDGAKGRRGEEGRRQF